MPCKIPNFARHFCFKPIKTVVKSFFTKNYSNEEMAFKIKYLSLVKSMYIH